MIPIVFTTDHNYIMQTGVCIYSLLAAAKDCEYDINVIVADNVTESDEDLLRQQVSAFPLHSITFVRTNGEFNGWFEIRGISKACYYRLLIPWLLPQYDKVIYSDVDVIFKTSLNEIFSLDLEDNYYAACQGSYFYFDNDAANYVQKLGLNPKQYVNSGFLLINSKKQRDDKLRDEFMQFSDKKLKFQDQDIVNLVCKGRIKLISPKYNITPSLYQQYIAQNPALYNFYGTEQKIKAYLKGEDCILHYTGAKPWNTFVFAFNEWWDTYKESIFYNEHFQLQKYKNIIHDLQYSKLSVSMILSFTKRRLMKFFKL